jgi:hyperosmotically inducible periplasmic protein
MSRRAWTNTATAAALALALGAVPASAQQGSPAADRDRQSGGAARADDQAREASSSTGEKITDAWILTKVKAQFVGEDALAHSNIDVDVRNHTVILKGTVASEAGKARAAAIARATDGVTSVQNNLRIGVANNTATDHDRNRGGDPTIARGTAPVAGEDVKDSAHDAKKSTKHAANHAKHAGKSAGAEAREESREATHAAKDTAHDAKHDAKDTAHDVKHDAKDTAHDVGRDTRAATGTAGQAVSDGWITTKVKSSFVGVDALDGSDINVDTNVHVVTLRGTVPSAAARARAVSLAKQVDGVKSVKDELTIGVKK